MRIRGVVALLLVAALRPLAAQTCTATNVANCTVTGNATRSVTVGVGYVARLILSTSTVTIPTPDIAQFDASVTGNGSFSFIVRANTPWQVSIRSTATTWTAAPLSARQTKPAGDLQWSLSAVSGFTNMTTSFAAVSSGTATAGSSVTVYLRAALAWTLETAGTYSLPLEVTVTSP
ncbi:hypothetical protein Strain138_001233 [Pseudogemmatithrix spongiicola]|uniref:Uncharacterized protein n=1 Tax=Pseudogemmatithrix spongiicola TaxID=3062599 RepID=A0AA49JTX5_9BACT|nr:hypothetical protein Strain138_001233 [Gemmatimonadaceae bacterium 'strain 138']WKW14872.1 hypothetical protein Strain318_001233 [Gemmatimonadaceae bacterium 'strain 318']